MPTSIRCFSVFLLIVLGFSSGMYGQTISVPPGDGQGRLSVSPAMHDIFLTHGEKQRLHPIFREIVLNYRHDRKDVFVNKFENLPLVMHKVTDDEILYDAIIYADYPASLRNDGIPINAVVGNIGTARLTGKQLSALARSNAVNYVEPASMRYPAMDISLYETRAHYLHDGYINDTPYTGEGAIVLVFDTGVDWEHMDFRDPDDTTKTRILYLWDVTLWAEGDEKPFGEELDWVFPYGVEYTKEDIEAALAGSDTIRSYDYTGHGTHVLGTAAGSGERYRGLAPGADIIVVKGGDFSFSSFNIINGLIYAQKRATDLGKPVVVNLSLGGHFGPHDGSRADEQAIDYLTQFPGYVVVTSAGNSGGNLMHVEGTTGPGTDSKITITIPEYQPWGFGDGFSINVWFEEDANATATVRTPSGSEIEFLPGSENTVPDTTDGLIYVWNGLDMTTNKRNIYFQVGNNDEIKPGEGTWELLFSGAGSWLHHDSTPSTFGIGTNSVDTFIVASRFDQDDLSDYYGNSIAEVHIYVVEGGGNDVTILVWEGSDESAPDTLIYEKNISDELLLDEWTVHIPAEPIVLHPEREYWIGYRINATGGFPLGVDHGPVVPGKGNMIFYDGVWQELTDLAGDLDYNWNIRAKLQETHPSDELISSYDGWLLGRSVGDKTVSLVNANNNKTVGMPGTARKAITVGAYVTKNSWMNFEDKFYERSSTLDRLASFSSIGPTADGRLKPEVAAPGDVTASVLAKNSDYEDLDVRILPGRKHVLLQGTSMASPHVAGATALLLGVNPMLTADDVKNLLTGTAAQDLSTGSAPNNRWGYGKMDIFGAVARELGSSILFDRELLVYHGSMVSSYSLTGSKKAALRFSPSIDGFISGLFVSIMDIPQPDGALQIELFPNNGGEPGASLHEPITIDLIDLLDRYFNYINLSGFDVEIEAGNEYFVVISLTEPTASITVAFDNGTGNDRRSLVYDDSSWNTFLHNGASREFLLRVEVTSFDDVTSVAGFSEIPVEYTLHQNYPNPFNPSTIIRYGLSQHSPVTLTVFNILGQQVAELVNEVQGAGNYEITFDASDLSSGVYLYRLQAGGFVQARKLILVK
jgi:subtilisin family serine protease